MPRTAGIPVYVSGPYDLRITRPNLERDFPGNPLDRAAAGRRDAREAVEGPAALVSGSAPTTEAERIRLAREAAQLLARIAADHQSLRWRPTADRRAGADPGLELTRDGTSRGRAS